jgi:hypothetical protein
MGLGAPGWGSKFISIHPVEDDDAERDRVFRQDGGSFVELRGRDSATDAQAPFLRSLSRSARLETPGRDRRRVHVDRAGKDLIQ